MCCKSLYTSLYATISPNVEPDLDSLLDRQRCVPCFFMASPISREVLPVHRVSRFDLEHRTLLVSSLSFLFALFITFDELANITTSTPCLHHRKLRTSTYQVLIRIDPRHETTYPAPPSRDAIARPVVVVAVMSSRVVALSTQPFDPDVAAPALKG